MELTDIGIPLTVNRYYDSIDDSNSLIGKGWRTNHETNANENPYTGRVAVTYPDGRTIVFNPIGSGEYAAPETVYDKLFKNTDNTYTLYLKDKTVYKYDSSGRITEVADKNGNKLNYAYDAYNKLIRVTSQTGKYYSFAYENGRIKTIIDSTGRYIEYFYNANGYLTSVRDVMGGSTVYGYTGGFLTSITDPNGRQFITNVYDKFGRVTSQADEDGNITIFEYDDTNRVNTVTFATGVNVSYQYNDKLYITQKTFSDGTYLLYQYDTRGNRTSVTDENGNTTTYTYDEKGNLVQKISPSPFNYIKTYTYDSNDNLTGITTSSGYNVTFTYDSSGNMTGRKLKLDENTYSQTTYTYDSYGRVLTIRDPENNITVFEYGNECLPVRVTDPENNTVIYEYDSLERPISLTTAYGTTIFEYDNMGKTTKIIDPEGNITRMKYDSVGNLIKLIMPEQYNIQTDDGPGYTYIYDAMDRLLKQIDPLNNVLAKKYDADGNIVKKINPNYYNPVSEDGIGVTYGYDERGRLVTIKNPSGEMSRIKYDPAGNIVKSIDANNYNEVLDDGPGMEYIYDELNRLIEIKDTEGVPVRRHVYDEDGRVIKEIDAKGILSGTNDGNRYGTVYKYNLAGWLTERRIPLKEENGTIYYNITRYEYDLAGRLFREKRSSEYVTLTGEPSTWDIISYTYYCNGLVRSITDSEGACIEYEYDCLGNTTKEKVKINDSKYKITRYEYDGAGNIIKKIEEADAEDLAEGGTGTILCETVYEYDRNGNITRVITPGGYETTFEYDDAGRLLSVNKQVSVDQIDVYRAEAKLVSDRRFVYPYMEYEYTLNIKPDSIITAVDMEIEYDARIYEVAGSEALLAGITADTSVPGIITVTGAGLNISRSQDVCRITFRPLENVKGTGYVVINPESTYLDGSSNEYRFIEVTGMPVMLNAPDMNDDGKVETDDFTLTALMEGKTQADPAYHEKYDINANGIVDIPDLDYIKDWLFDDSPMQMNSLEKIKFYERITNAVYSDSIQTVTRTTSYQYDSAGNITRVTDCNQNNIVYEYDAYNRLIRTTDQSGDTTRIYYDETGNIIKEVLPENYDGVSDNGPGTTYEYDTMGRLSRVTDAHGNVIQKLVYDINGNILKSIDAKGYLSAAADSQRYGIEYTYDIGNRLRTVTTPEADLDSVTSAQYEYDAAGNVTQYTDGEGNTTTYERDMWGRAIRITDADNVDTFYTYDYAGNVTSSKDGNSNTTYYRYNSLNLLYQIEDPAGDTLTYLYDREGRLERETDRNGNEINYSYNSDGQLVNKTVTGEEIYEKYLYNKDGSLLAAINNSGVDRFEYTADGLVQKRYTNGILKLQYAYDKNDRVTGVTDEFGNTTGYEYDTLGRIDRVLDSAVEIASYTYNEDSTIQQVSYNTGITAAFDYDRDKNIISLANKDPQQAIISSFSYTYDNNGNILTENKNGQVTTYTYDALGRLKTVSCPDKGLETFTYDNAGNRLSRTLGDINETYQYDNRNRLTQKTINGIISSYTYDSNGNLLTEATAGNVTSYAYNAFNRLTEVTKSDGTWMRNTYDALGMRTSVLENGIWTGFTFDGGSIISESDASNELKSRYIRGYSLIALQYASSQTGYYLHNAHGDVTGIVDAAGQVLNSYSYDAFGNAIDQLETVRNRFMYAGEQYDQLTGQYYLRNRYYDPSIGRFTQEDPFRGDSLNLYAYVSNNPLKYVDPWGLCKDTVKGTGSGDITLTSGDLIFLYNSGLINDLPMEQRAAILLNLKEDGKITGDDLVDMGVKKRKEYKGLLGRLEKAFDPSNPDNMASLLSTEYKLSQYDMTLMELEYEEQKIRLAEVQGLIYLMAVDVAMSKGSNDSNVPEPEFKGFNLKDGENKGTSKTNPLENIKYTDKVNVQMKQGDYHSFPESVDAFGADGKVTQITGGDNVVRTKVEIPGSYQGIEGIFEYIIEPDGLTCNHRLFRPNN